MKDFMNTIKCALVAAVAFCAFGAWAAEIDYVDADGTLKHTYGEYVENKSTRQTWYGGGWYYVTGNITLSKGVDCQVNGHARLILGDGATLTIDAVEENKAGIKVTGGSSLTIYGQTGGTGRLVVTGGSSGAGIGGGNAEGGSNITVNGGVIVVQGGNGAAGIGGGNGEVGSNIKVNRGWVTANGGEGAVGIGSGNNGGTSSSICATNNMIVKAGDAPDPTTEIEHESTTDLATMSAFNKRYVTMEPRPQPLQDPVEYTAPVYVDNVASNGIAYWTTNKVTSYMVVTSAASQVSWGAVGVTNWFAVTNNVEIDGVVCQGYVNLILCEGAKLTVTNTAGTHAGIETDENGSFTVYGQPDGAGELEAFGGENGAGIGGGKNDTGRNITINGGTITAIGGILSSGIGGGQSGNGSNITINGGKVKCISGNKAAGIGGGGYGDGFDITINGGQVVAIGAAFGSGIGSGYAGRAYNVVINDGWVEAYSDLGGAAIGTGAESTENGSCRNIAINGGKVMVASAVNIIQGDVMNTILIGGGYHSSPASNVVISSAANVLFNVTGFVRASDNVSEPILPGPDYFEGFVIQTSGTQEWSRVLVEGLGESDAAAIRALPFVITNAATGATGSLDVNGGEIAFANVFCRLTNDVDRLAFEVRWPKFAISQQPDMTNGYEIVASTDGNRGITDYAWIKRVSAVTDFHTLTNLMATGEEVYYGTADGTDLRSVDFNVDADQAVVVVWMGSLPPGGEFHFTCSSTLVDVGTILVGDTGTLVQDGENCVYVPKLVMGNWLALCFMNADVVTEQFVLKNLRYVVNTDETVAHGADLTALPADKGEMGQKYLCQITYGHEDIIYTGDSDEFTYVVSTPISAQPIPVENTTMEVFTNGFRSTEFETGKWYAWSNLTATVVYTAKPGYVFEGGVTEKTIELDTTVNPAVNKGGEVPVFAASISYLAPVYKGTDGNPTNGIAYWVTNRIVVSDVTFVTSAVSQVTWGTEGVTNWFAVTNADVKIKGGVKCKGYVNLILCEGAKLVVTNLMSGKAGIATDENGSFTVYGQPDGAGELEAFGSYYGAGIGGGRNGVGRNITINGGVVTASGGEFGAGIGGGDSGGNSVNITINGGKVTATGGMLGAGIGGGCYGSGANITINAGAVTANGGMQGAGIGGGNGHSRYEKKGGNAENIVINGGKVVATGGNGSAAIGGGLLGIGSNITISVATVFVCGVADSDSETGVITYSDLVGNGALCDDSAIGVLIDSSAKVFFNLTGIYDMSEETWLEAVAPMPEDFEGFVIMTPETPTNRVLVAGLSGLPGGQPLPAFALTNAVTGATGTIDVNGAGVVFAERLLELPCADGKLTLTSVITPVEVSPTEIDNTTFRVFQGGKLVEKTGGKYMVPSNSMVEVVYVVSDDDYRFEDGATWKSAQFVADGTPGTPESVRPDAPVLYWTASKALAFDVREHKVILDPEEMLSIAYSTNNWQDDKASSFVVVNVTNENTGAGVEIVATNENGQVDWMPLAGAYGLYNFLAIGENEVTNLFGYVYYTANVELITNGLDVAGTSFKVYVGEDEVLPNEDGKYIVETNSQVVVKYEITEDGVYFDDGTKKWESAPLPADKAINNLAEIGGKVPEGHEPKAPSARLGLVAQRYPWNGIVDVNYQIRNWPGTDGYVAKLVVTVGETCVTNEIDCAGMTGIASGIQPVDLNPIAASQKGKAKFSVFVEQLEE